MGARSDVDLSVKQRRVTDYMRGWYRGIAQSDIDMFYCKNTAYIKGFRDGKNDEQLARIRARKYFKVD